jgi:methionyl-tRNA synthetase
VSQVRSRTTVIFTPPPTPNGGLHLGHAAGPYLRADLHRRLVGLVGGECVHLSHIDTFQTYVARKAAEQDRDVEEFRDDMAARIRADFESIGVLFDGGVDNTSEMYARYLASCVDALFRSASIQIGRECVGGDSRYSAVEAFVSGTCPHCLQRAAANVCEACGAPLLLDDLLRPSDDVAGGSAFSEISDGMPNQLSVGELDVEWLQAWIAQVECDSPFVHGLVQNLRPHCVTVTFRSTYGYPISPGRVLNPWIEIFFAHVYSLGRLIGVPEGATIHQVRRALEEQKDQLSVVYYFGADNTYYYAALFPLLSRILGQDALLPVALKGNRFLRVHGRKMSSSRDNALWAADLDSAQPVPVVRAGLARQSPELSEVDFRMDAIGTPEQWSRATDVIDMPELDRVPDTRAGEIFSGVLTSLARPGGFSIAELLAAFDRAADHRTSGRATAEEEAELGGLIARARQALLI